MSICTCDTADYDEGRRCALHVECDEDCRALEDPHTLEEYERSLTHWREHSSCRAARMVAEQSPCELDGASMTEYLVVCQHGSDDGLRYSTLEEAQAAAHEYDEGPWTPWCVPHKVQKVDDT